MACKAADFDRNAKPTRSLVERQGIEFVPLDARYGTSRRLFTVWFSVNLSILCLTVGSLGVRAGLPLGWTVLALAVGNVIGTIFMAAHSAQGPHLGIPQMIQSRAQFGVLGAGLPLIAVVASTTLYTSANAILIKDAVRMLLPVSNLTAIVLFGGITVAIAFIGYELIHRVGAALAFVSGALFVAVAVLLFTRSHPAQLGSAAAAGHFTTATFLLVMTQATAWSLSSGPTVADYSRYLPASVSAWETFWYTALGNGLSSFLMMSLGAYLAAQSASMATHAGIGLADLFGPGRYLVALLIIANLLQVNVMTLYSAYMSSTTIITGVRGMRRVSLSYKLAMMVLLMGIATWVAVTTQNSFDTYFSDLLAILVYLLIPWSAINLADYYVVRKGRYSIEQLFQLDGIYGRYSWIGIGVYLFTVLIQIPFVSLSFYTGSVAHLLGADIAWLPGLVVPAVLYCLIQRDDEPTD